MRLIRDRRVVLVASVAVVLVGCGAPLAPAASAPVTAAGGVAAEMIAFDLNGYSVTGAEYWPYIDHTEIREDRDVLWGFYPEKGVAPPGESDPNVASATPKALECALQSYRALRVFLSSSPPDLRAITERGKARGYTNRFWMWTNDYSKTTALTPTRPARLWYWKREKPDPARPAGFWKWEATLTAQGQCQVPEAAQIRASLSAALADLP